MPLQVDIRVNGEFIDQLHIGRNELLRSTDQISEYIVVRGRYDRFDVPWDNGDGKFTHKYSDGALVCVQKAIAALNDPQV